MEMVIKNTNVIVKSIIHKFYTNVPIAINNRVMVSGVLVAFVLSNINTLYWLIDVSQGEYEMFLDSAHYEEVIETLIMDRPEWEFFNGRHKSLKLSTYLRSPIFSNIFFVLNLCQAHTTMFWRKSKPYYSSP